MENKSNFHKIYMAAPLFNPMERERNIRYATKLTEVGFDLFIPQVHSGEAKLKNSKEGTEREKIFERDVAGVVNSDIVIAFVNGRVPDEGTCFELGMAYALNKVVIVVNDDDRSFMDGHMNVMIEECIRGHKLSRYCNRFEDALKHLMLTKTFGGRENEE